MMICIGIKAFDALVAELALRYGLIHRLRIADFHHYPVRGAGFAVIECRTTVPAFSIAALTFDTSISAPSLRIDGVKLAPGDGFFMTAHGFIQDELEAEAIPLDVLLSSHFVELEKCIDAFAELQRA